MIGRRLSDAKMGESGPGWDEWKDRQPGDYMRVDFDDGEPIGWYICDPLGRVGLIGRRRIHLEPLEGDAGTLIPVVQPPVVEPWKIVEHDDETITVTPSIMDPSGWHGYLTNGVWCDTFGNPA